MSKKNYLFFFVLTALVFAACGETEEVNKYANWQARNEAFIDSIANVYAGQQNGSIPVTDEKDSLYHYKDDTNGQWIYVKKIKNGDGTESPKYTSTISAYYRMSYFTGEVVQQTYTGAEPTEFDSPATFVLNSSAPNGGSVISGWSYTLIHMKVGDFWTLYIPYQSGYGSGTGPNKSLQPYSALVYHIKLDKIVEL